MRVIVKEEGEARAKVRCDKIEIDQELLRKLYIQCNCHIQRVHEKLMEEKGIRIGYSTLTRMIRELNISTPVDKRSEHVPEIPGVEMQHDTSVYKVEIANKPIKMICSLLYFRYSKVRYVKFYRSFNRFRMKCFFHEALTFFGYTARECVIDNTNLARLYGSGKKAVIAPEMEDFSKRYGFKFLCHEIGHSNRKAGIERAFYTVETNFIPGRRFETLEDLNQQAFDWAVKRIANRPTGKTGLIPQKAFEHEQAFLVKLPPFVEPPYRQHKRSTDQYGYVMFGANFYLIPGTTRGDVTLLEYDESIKIYHNRNLLVNYKLPAFGLRNQSFLPPGHTGIKYKPNNRKNASSQQEKLLRAISEEVNAYIDFVIKSNGIQRHKFIMALFTIHRRLALSLFIESIKRALKYGITDMDTVERIGLLLIREDGCAAPFAEIDKDVQKRDQYIEGALSDEVDLSLYDKLGDDDG